MEEHEQKARIIVEKRKKALDKSLLIVEELLDGTADESSFQSLVRFIDPSHYDDVVEERTIIKKCGYALCDKPLKPIGARQKYHVSTKQNKVYDITERKKFCSNQCFKASRFLRNQIPSTPVWDRNKGVTPILQFLPLSGKGGEPGDVVVQNPAAEVVKVLETLGIHKEENGHKKNNVHNEKSVFDERIGLLNSESRDIATSSTTNSSITSDLNNLSSSSHGVTEDKFTDIIDLIDRRDAMIAQLEGGQSKSVFKFSKNQNSSHRISESRTPLPVSDRSADIHSSIKGETVCPNAPSQISSENMSSQADGIRESPVMKNQLSQIEKCLSEWKTDLTVFYLTKGGVRSDESLDAPDGLPDVSVLEHMLDSVNITPLQFSAPPSEKLPDYKQLLEHSRQQMLQVKESFFRGDADSDDDAEDVDVDKTSKEKIGDHQRVSVLPFVDNSSQLAIRRKIVLNSIDKCLPKILPSLDLLPSNVSSGIYQLVQTFSLSKDNISFKPAEWNLLTIMLLKILSLRDTKLAETFKKEKSIQFYESALSVYHINESDIDIIIRNISTNQ